MKRSLFARLLAGTLVCLSVSCAQKELVVPDISVLRSSPAVFGDYVSNMILLEMSKKGITGLAIAVVDGPDTVYQAGFGYADRDLRSSVLPNTIFNIGSVTKVFTATAVMQLYERGLIDLDRPITAYLPEFSIRLRGTNQAVPTVRRLLCHHSGLPSESPNGFWLGTNSAEYANGFMRLPAMLSNETMAYPPDAVFSYCNLGFSLLGVIVARVSGMDFESYVRKNIFTPLGMNDSSFIIRYDIKTKYAKGYYNGNAMDIPRIRDLPAGALNSTSADMANFLKMVVAGGSWHGNAVLGTDAMKEMLTVQNRNAPLDGDFKIGLAYWLMSYPELRGETAAQHGGDLPPYHALLVFMPERKIGVVIMVNSLNGSSSDLNPVAFRVLSALIEMKTRMVFEPLVREKPPLRDITPAEVLHFAGYYAGPLGLVEIRKCGDGLQVIVDGKVFDILVYRDNTLGLRFRLFGLFPIDTEQQDRVRLRPFEYQGETCCSLDANGYNLTFNKVEPCPVPGSWSNAAGTYLCTNTGWGVPLLKVALVHDRETGFYVLKVSEMTIPLDLLNDREAVTMGYGRGLGETLRLAADGGNTNLLFSGYVMVRAKD